MSFRRALVIANPIAGRGRARERAQELARGMDAMGIAAELFFTTRRGDAPRRLADLGPTVDLVVAVGGDGTLGEVLEGLPREVTVGLLPMGTANVFGVDVGLPRDVRGLLGLIAAGHTTLVDLADVDGRLSFLVTGVGFDGWVVRDVERRRRGPITKLTYVLAVLRGLRCHAVRRGAGTRRHRAPRLRVELDGEALPGVFAWVLVSNVVGPLSLAPRLTAWYGGVLRLSPLRVLDDGLYEVFLFSEGSPWALIRYGLRGLFRRLPGGTCRMLRARRVHVTSDDPVPYQVDGDFGGETPVSIEVTGARRRLLVPKPTTTR